MNNKKKSQRISMILLAVILTAIAAGSVAGVVISETPRPTIVVEFGESVTIAGTTITSKEGQLFEAEKIFEQGNIFKYKPKVGLENNDYTFSITVEDFLENVETSTFMFRVEKIPLEIILVYPRHGASQTAITDVILETDISAKCRYSLDSPLEFENMPNNIPSSGTTHTISSFSVETGPEDIYVKCNDSEGAISDYVHFRIYFDGAEPLLETVTATPALVISEPIETTFTAVTNEPSICKYSETNSDYENMESTFTGHNPYETGAYKTQNTATITGLTAETRNYTYYVSCEDLSGRHSNTKNVTFKVDLNVGFSAVIVSPAQHHTTNETSLILNVNTNKKGYTTCKYGTQADSITNPFLTVNEDTTTHELILSSLSEERYKYYVECTRFAETDTKSVEFIIDRSPPYNLTIDDTYEAAYLDKLRAEWHANDALSGVDYYEYAIGSTAGETDIKDWRDVGGSTSATARNLNLTDGETYYWTVKAYDKVGYFVKATSDGVTVDTSQLTPTCDDGIRNHGEADIDCGGPCAGCIDGKDCYNDDDCLGDKCENNICKTHHCSNGEKDEDESDVDCGGSCPTCSNGDNCDKDSDCLSGYCDQVCKSPSCFDGKENGQETDIDCGGPSCEELCEVNQKCEISADCKSNSCDDNTRLCVAPSCNDGKKNQDETDEDCGGSCPKCGENAMCNSGDDCISEICEYGVCVGEGGDDDQSDEDTDGDGLPDWWEEDNGLNPYEDDAQEDVDGDDLTNYDEYEHDPAMDPQNRDTDGDGYADGAELADGFDPLDSDDHPKSRFWLIFLIIAILALLLGGGYVIYTEYYEKGNNKGKLLPLLPKKLQNLPIFKKSGPNFVRKEKTEQRSKEIASAFGVFSTPKKPVKPVQARPLPVRMKKPPILKKPVKKETAPKKKRPDWINVSDINKKETDIIKKSEKKKEPSIFEKLSKTGQKTTIAKKDNKDDIFKRLPKFKNDKVKPAKTKPTVNAKKETKTDKEDVFKKLSKVSNKTKSNEDVFERLKKAKKAKKK